MPLNYAVRKTLEMLAKEKLVLHKTTMQVDFQILLPIVAFAMVNKKKICHKCQRPGVES
jgi:hypothetical protein